MGRAIIDISIPVASSSTERIILEVTSLLSASSESLRPDVVYCSVPNALSPIKMGLVKSSPHIQDLLILRGYKKSIRIREFDCPPLAFSLKPKILINLCPIFFITNLVHQKNFIFLLRFERTNLHESF